MSIRYSPYVINPLLKKITWDERENSAGKHRVFTDADVERLKRIMRFKAIVGHPLCEIKDLLDMDEERKTLLSEAEATLRRADKARKLERVREIFIREPAALGERKSTIEEVERYLQERIDGIEQEPENLGKQKERGRARVGKSVTDG